MATAAAARSVFRSCSARGKSVASMLASEAKAARSPFRNASKKSLSSRLLSRSPVEMSFCVESMLPYHTATASALLTSMLSVTRCTYGWLPEVSTAGTLISTAGNLITDSNFIIPCLRYLATLLGPLDVIFLHNFLLAMMMHEKSIGLEESLIES